MIRCKVWILICVVFVSCLILKVRDFEAVQQRNGGGFAGLHSAEFVDTDRFLWSLATVPERTSIWAVGNNGMVVFSADTGESWTRKPVTTRAALYKVTFTTSSNGWIVGDQNTLLSTSNGGADWIAQAVRVPMAAFTSINFVGSSLGWISTSAGGILSTIDSGRTWNQQRVGNPNESLLDVRFIDAKNGWAVGAMGLALRTTDGGASWQNVDLPRGLPATTNFTRVLVQKDVAGVFGWMLAEGAILNTQDGNTWTRQRVSTSLSLRGIFAFDRLQPWAVDLSGVVLQSLNGGATWRYDSLAETTDLADVLFVDPFTGFVAGSEVYRTSSAGRTWSSVCCASTP